MRIAIFATALSVCMYVGNVLADPSPEVVWLMKEPVTLFDQGMRRIEEELKALKDWYDPNDPEINSSSTTAKSPTKLLGRYVRYLYEENRIELVTLANLQAGSKATGELCQSELVEIQRRFFLGEYTKDKYVTHQKRTKDQQLAAMVGEWFAHEGYQRLSEPVGLGEAIAKLLFLELYLSPSEGGKASVSCSMPLRGGDVKITIRQ